MKIYGIIAAMKEEMQEIEKIMTEKKVQKIYELNFIKGKINNTEIVLVNSGVGKVNAARTTQILIDNFNIELNVAFSTYAIPMIIGEIKRYVRDNSNLKISRQIKDLAYKILKFKEEWDYMRNLRETREISYEKYVELKKENLEI